MPLAWGSTSSYRGWRTARLARRVESPHFDVIDVEPDLDESLYPLVCEAVQCQSSDERALCGTLMDLRRARDIKPALFECLVQSCQAARIQVPRLGILLDYVAWTVLRPDAERALRRLGDAGTQTHVFYAQQARDDVAWWFERGHVRHTQLGAVLSWLRTEWQPAPDWSKVLDATTVLVQSSAPREDVTGLLIELAAIALSFEDDAAKEGGKHARAALSWAGGAPRPARCQALRALGVAELRLGDTRAGLLHLDAAIREALVIDDRVEEASAYVELARHWLRTENLARAEREARQAIEALASAGPAAPASAPVAAARAELREPAPVADAAAELRATTHRLLAEALHAQGIDSDEAERHAEAAVALRRDRSSRLVAEDCALLALIRASRSMRSAHSSDQTPAEPSRGKP